MLGLERLSKLKELQILNLSGNTIGNGIFPSFAALTSLRILDLRYTALGGLLPAYGKFLPPS